MDVMLQLERDLARPHMVSCLTFSSKTTPFLLFRGDATKVNLISSCDEGIVRQGGSERGWSILIRD